MKDFKTLSYCEFQIALRPAHNSGFFLQYAFNIHEIKCNPVIMSKLFP